jgi:putative selenium metabolism protein SsnA
MIITNGRIVIWGSQNAILLDQALLIENGLIQKISKVSELLRQYPKQQVIDARNMLIMPGNICAHTHFYGAFARGMAIPGEPPSNFVQILKRLWWKLDKALDEEAIRYSTLVCLIDAIKHGTTTLIDHHASPNTVDGSLDFIADEVRQSGLRASLCYEVTDRDGNERAVAGIAENSRFINKIKQSKVYDGLIRAHFGLHASLTLSDRTLEKCVRECPPEIGFHSHAAEGIADQEDCIEKYGKRVIERFNDLGILKENSIMAHGIHLDDHEMDLFAKTRTWLTHQPRSNMNNAVGVAQVEKMLQKGVRIGLGNDGFSNAMWDEWKTAYLIHKDHHGDPQAMNGYTLLQVAMSNNADLATSIFNDLRIGEIKEGAAADLIFVNYREFTPMNAGNLPWHILFGFREGMVDSTMVAGKFLMRNKQIITLDESDISRGAILSAIKTWKKVEEQGS